MSCGLDDELTLHIEIRDDWKKPAEYKIEKLRNGFTKFTRKDSQFDAVECLVLYCGKYRVEVSDNQMVQGYKQFTGWKKELRMIRAYFKLVSEQDMVALCDYSRYFILTIGKNFNDSCETELQKKYKGWKYIEFEHSFDDLFMVPKFKKHAEEKHIEVRVRDWPQLIMFFKDKIDIWQALNWYSKLAEEAGDLQSQLNTVYRSFAKGSPWKCLK